MEHQPIPLLKADPQSSGVYVCVLCGSALKESETQERHMRSGIARGREDLHYGVPYSVVGKKVFIEVTPGGGGVNDA